MLTDPFDTPGGSYIFRVFVIIETEIKSGEKKECKFLPHSNRIHENTKKKLQAPYSS
jgi:hypothetical protein